MLELIFVPSPGAGHMMSMVETAKMLAARDSRLVITVLVLKFPLDTGTNATAELLSSVSDRIKFFDLPQDNVDPAEFTPLYFLRYYYENQKLHVRRAVQRILSQPDSGRLAGFVVDMLCVAVMIDVANEFGVPTYVFYASGAGTLSLLFHLQAMMDRKNAENPDQPRDEIVVPGFANSVPETVFPALLLDKDAAPLCCNLFRRAREARGILVNTFAELESDMVEALSSVNLPRVYPVGPVINFKPGDKHAGYGQSHKMEEIMAWLDGQPVASVVFLCFGSMGSFSVDQVKEIAVALECSGVRFLWSLRRAPQAEESPFPTEYSNPAEALPEGFLQRTTGFGRVIGWAPQVAVLGHPAIGGFVSHCGWNSILESVHCGVPIATWPLFAEQQINAFQLTKESGLAVAISIDYRRDFKAGSLVGEDSGDLLVTDDKIETGILRLMEKESDTRKRMKEMSEKSKKALLHGGSSHTSLSLFIQGIFNNVA